MIRHGVIFAATFILGAFIAIILRTSRHQPYAQPPMVDHASPGMPAMPGMPAGPAAVPDHAGTHDRPSVTPAADADNGASPAATDATSATSAMGMSMATGTVNTVCAICGMAVDPNIPTASYQGKRIGFGCGKCPPKFAADPERYGPFALTNQVAK